MRRVKKSVVVVIMMLFSIILFSMTNVHAANKKLKVNKVYTTTKKIKGKTKKKYLVKVKIGKKIYKKKASSKGNFTIPIPKQKVGKKLTVKAYRKKNMKWKLYAKKTITVKKKTVKATTKSKYPGKEDAIDLEQVKKDLATGKKIHKADLGSGKGKYLRSERKAFGRKGSCGFCRFDSRKNERRAFRGSEKNGGASGYVGFRY